MAAVQELDDIQVQDDVIVKGSTWLAIWHMSWPSLVQMLTIALASFADVWVAGKLGSDVQAAIGVGGQIWYLMIMVAVALCAGATAIVSRYWGAKDLDGAIEASRQSLIFGFLFGITSATIGLLLARPLFHVLGASPAVEKQGWDYMKWDLLSQLPFTIIWIANSIQRAKGNARVPMGIWLLMTSMTIALDFVFCLGPFHFGISGIGMAWTVASTVGMALSLYLISRSEIADCLNFRKMLSCGLSREWMMRLLRIGIPSCIQEVAWIGGNFVLFSIFAQTASPTECQASWSVGLRLEEMIAGLPVHALAMAIGTIVGQNLGAKQPLRAQLAGWQVAGIACAYNVVVGAIMFFFAEPIARLMSTDPKVIAFTTQYLQIVGLSEPFMAAWMTLFGAMQGAGYTKAPMWTSCLILTAVRLPIAWWLTITLQLGPAGTWIAISLANVTIGLYALWRFRTGVWQLQKV